MRVSGKKPLSRATMRGCAGCSLHKGTCWRRQGRAEVLRAGGLKPDTPLPRCVYRREGGIPSSPQEQSMHQTLHFEAGVCAEGVLIKKPSFPAVKLFAQGHKAWERQCLIKMQSSCRVPELTPPTTEPACPWRMSMGHQVGAGGG